MWLRNSCGVASAQICAGHVEDGPGTSGTTATRWNAAGFSWEKPLHPWRRDATMPQLQAFVCRKVLVPGSSSPGPPRIEDPERIAQRIGRSRAPRRGGPQVRHPRGARTLSSLGSSGRKPPALRRAQTRRGHARKARMDDIPQGLASSWLSRPSSIGKPPARWTRGTLSRDHSPALEHIAGGDHELAGRCSLRRAHRTLTPPAGCHRHGPLVIFGCLDGHSWQLGPAGVASGTATLTATYGLHRRPRESVSRRGRWPGICASRSRSPGTRLTVEYANPPITSCEPAAASWKA